MASAREPPRGELPFEGLALQFERLHFVLLLPDLPLRHDRASAESFQTLE